MALLEVNGIHLETARFGDAHPGRPTLVFLHHGLGCVALWRDFPERLAAAKVSATSAWPGHCPESSRRPPTAG